MDSKTIEELKRKIVESYSPEDCGATPEWNMGNYDDVFEDGNNYGRSWLAYEIGCILGMELQEPEEQKWSWEE